jgi:hypothetical protein
LRDGAHGRALEPAFAELDLCGLEDSLRGGGSPGGAGRTLPDRGDRRKIAGANAESLYGLAESGDQTTKPQ